MVVGAVTVGNRLLVQIVQCAIDNVSQDVRFTVTLKPWQYAGGQLGKVIHRKALKCVKHFFGNGTKLKAYKLVDNKIA